MAGALITGGAGFIGSHLAQRLASLGEDVVVLDDLSTGSMANLEGIDVGFVEGSILDVDLVDRLAAEHSIVFHLAAAVGVRRILERPLASFRANLRGTETVLEAAARHGTKVVLASTSEVYGKSRQVPFREDADRVLGAPSVVRWAYAEAKALDEFVASCLGREEGLPFVVARLFNTVGPRQVGTYGMVVPTFVRQALAGQPLTVHGDGTQARCFTHVDDTVDALLLLAREDACVGGTYNVGSSERTTVMALAERVIERTGSSSGIEIVPYDVAYGPGFEDMPVREPDTTALRAATGWEPKRDLDDILRDVIDHESRP